MYRRKYPNVTLRYPTALLTSSLEKRNSNFLDEEGMTHCGPQKSYIISLLHLFCHVNFQMPEGLKIQIEQSVYSWPLNRGLFKVILMVTFFRP